MIKRNVLIVLCCLITQQLAAQTKKIQANLDYIEKYGDIAIDGMNQFGIPASITLAQGILESAAGRSELAQKSNNHFGIKCHGWTGASVLHDDDEKNECFRKYDKPEDSFKDHSLFLQRPRYKSLFDLHITDYKGWAKGLKQCGYATNPQYADMLINIIETYELHAYDQGIKKEKEREIAEVKKEEKDLTTTYLLQSTMGEISPYATHTVKKVNGKKAVIAKDGDTYESIAKEFGLRNWEIRWYNKVKKGAVPVEGQTVYL